MEGDNFNVICNCEMDLLIGDLLDKYFFMVFCYGKVYVDGKFDYMLCYLFGLDVLYIWLRFWL